MSYSVGSLVTARNRDWVVLPESEDDLLVLRPLGGTEDEIAGILTDLEDVTPATFAWPTADDIGDFTSGRLLREALRIGFRSASGPFRSIANIAVTPRPYQLVPLLMALRQDTTRLLIADDVGIGKTIEAGLIARERLDQGDVAGLCVLCPPHLAEQWQRELADKFHIDTELVLASTAAKLERRCQMGQSIFETFTRTVVSIDFVKSDRRRDEFLRTCPELVIVDEAHQAAFGEGKGRQQRHALVRDITKSEARHVVLVTATPHSGKDDAFRSLLQILDPAFADLPADLSGRENEAQRRRVARHLVQRRRDDIRHWLAVDTEFPEREDAEHRYRLSPAYRDYMRSVWEYARDAVSDRSESAHRRRVRWWSALALLRAVSSSPAAAIATLTNRAASADTQTETEADEAGRRTVMDLFDEATEDIPDTTPGTETGSGESRHLRDLSERAQALMGGDDAKLQGVVELTRQLLADGYSPLVFCRFVDTAKYVGEALAESLKNTHVEVVTGELPHDEREARVQRLTEGTAGDRRRVLVATDCLSEGINLQDAFDAVVHYDLAWNPTRHEQRAGRVDRFGQVRPKVRVVTCWGEDNPVDAKVREVLIKKHEKIRRALGISVPVPLDTNAVMEALIEGMLHFDWDRAEQLAFDIDPRAQALELEWEDAADREQKSRSLFAQHTIDVEEVRAALAEVQAAIGAPDDVERFVRDALAAADAAVSPGDPTDIDLTEAPPTLRDRLGTDHLDVKARFDLPVADDVLYLSRTHPLTSTLAQWVLDTALDPYAAGPAARCGAIRTDTVAERTTLLLVRYRHHLSLGRSQRSLAEEAVIVGFAGSPADPRWLPPEVVEVLLDATPNANISAQQAESFLARVLDARPGIQAALDAQAADRAEILADSHARVRHEAGLRGAVSVAPNLPADVLGCWILLPAAT